MEGATLFWIAALMKIALAQFNPTVGDFEGNAARILSLASLAKQRGAELAVFSELCICGYLPLDLLERPAFIRRNYDTLRLVASQMPLPAIVGYAGRVDTDRAGKSIANKAALISEGRVVFEQSKMLLPTYDVFDESRYFQPGEKSYVYGLGREQLGITICEDAWNDKTFWANPLYTRDPVTELIAQGTSVLINISASPYHMGKRALRLEMLRSIALRHNRAVVYVNQVGGNDSLIFDGASMAVTAKGEIAAQAKSFEEDLILYDTVTETGGYSRAACGGDCLRFSGAGNRDARLCAEVRISQDDRGIEWGSGLGSGGFAGGDGFGSGERAGRVDAGPVFVAGKQIGCTGVSAEPGD